jgi:hypothetical protein
VLYASKISKSNDFKYKAHVKEMTKKEIYKNNHVA